MTYITIIMIYHLPTYLVWMSQEHVKHVPLNNLSIPGYRSYTHTLTYTHTNNNIILKYKHAMKILYNTYESLF